MSDDEMIRDATRRIFRDLGAPQAIILAGDDSWQAPLWAALEDAGLTRAWLPEDLGGAGLGVGDTFALLQEAGAHAVAVPLAETLLAGRALAQASLAQPDGMLTVAPVGAGEALSITADGRVTGIAYNVPFAREAGHLVAVGDGVVALVPRSAAEIAPADSVAGEPRDTIRFEAAPAVAHGPAALDAAALRRLGAAMRAMQMAGAMQGVLDMTVGYAGERVAFGRPIGRFQAVQHLLARLAEEAAAALAAAASAAHAIETLEPEDPGVLMEVATAKVRAGEAAGEVALIGHQVHGAIGFTDEHILHRYVQRLWAWRDDFGAEAEWAAGLGRVFARRGGGAFWPTVTAS